MILIFFVVIAGLLLTGIVIVQYFPVIIFAILVLVAIFMGVAQIFKIPKNKDKDKNNYK